MSNMDQGSIVAEASEREIDKVVHDFRLILIDGIKHGFFSAAISVTTIKSDRREVLIAAGKSYKYTIKVDDLPR